MSAGRVRQGLRCAGVLALVACSPSASATNGFNFFAFGAESSGVGGADVALVRDTAALVTNPAGLDHIASRQLESSLDPYYFIDVRHTDSLGNDRQNQPRAGAFTSLAYAQRVNDDIVAGIGAYVAGGLGFEYQDMDSGFGTRGDIVTRFSVLRLAPGLSFRVNDRLTLGASLSINYAMARQRFFIESSVLNPLDIDASLFGFRLDGLSALGYGLNVGLKIVPFDDQRWVFGLAYRSHSDLALDGGELTVNYEALGAGRIVYRDAELRGVTIPQDVQAGLMFRPSDRWVFTAEVNWINWAQAIDHFRVVATDPERNPLPLLIPETVEQAQALDWRDQLVLSAGTMFVPDGSWRFMAGVNYGKQPVPARNLSPLIAAIPERHYTLGMARKFWEHWDLKATVVYIAPTSVRYRNPSSPITADASESHETLAFVFGLSRSW